MVDQNEELQRHADLMNNMVDQSRMNSNAMADHGRRMNSLSSEFAGTARNNAAMSGIGLAAVALRQKDNQLSQLQGQLQNSNSSGNAAKAASFAGGFALQQACEEISKLKGESVASVAARYNKVRTLAFVGKLTEYVKRGSVDKDAISEYQDVPWVDRSVLLGEPR